MRVFSLLGCGVAVLSAVSLMLAPGLCPARLGPNSEAGKAEKRKTLSGLPRYVTSLAFSKEGRYLIASCAWDLAAFAPKPAAASNVILWDLISGKAIWQKDALYRGEKCEVRWAGLHPDTKQIWVYMHGRKAFLDRDEKVRLLVWNRDDGEIIHRREGMYVIGFTADGKGVYGGFVGSFGVMDCKTLITKHKIPGGSAEISRDGGRCVAVDYDVKRGRIARVVDTVTGKEVATVDLPELTDGKKHPYPPYARFHPDGNRVLLMSSTRGEVYTWDTKAGKLEKLFEVDVTYPRISGNNFQLHPDGKQFAVIDRNLNVVLWDLETRKKVATVDPDELGQPTCLTFSPSGDWLAVGCAKGAVLLHPLTK